MHGQTDIKLIPVRCKGHNALQQGHYPEGVGRYGEGDGI